MLKLSDKRGNYILRLLFMTVTDETCNLTNPKSNSKHMTSMH